MQAILLRHALRELRAHAARYVSLPALTILATYLVVSILAAAQSVIATTTGAAARNALEDGQFTLARTLTDEERDELVDAGVSVEAEPSLDFTVRNAAGTDATLRLLANRTDIDRVDVAAGRAAQGADEALVERRYAEVNGINAGDTLELGGRTLTVVGIGISPDYELCVREPSDAYAEASAFGTIFVTSQTYDELRDAGAASTAETLTYAYRFDASEATLPARDQVTTNADLRVWLRDHVGAALSGFMTAQDNPRVLAAADDVSINVRVSLFAGVIVFALVAYAVSVFVAHTVESERRSIGTLRALGVSSAQLVVAYALLATLMCLAGGIIGTALGYSGPGMSMTTDSTTGYYSVPNLQTAYVPWVVAHGLAMPPAIALVVNVIALRRLLSPPVLALLGDGPARAGEGSSRRRAPRGRADRIERAGFFRAFQLAQLSRDRRGVLAVLGGLFVSLLVLVLSLDCLVLASSAKTITADTITYERMYLLSDSSAKLPDDAEPAFVRGFTTTVDGYSMDVSVIGIEDANPYFPAVDDLHADEVNVGSITAQKLGLAPGDDFYLTDAATGSSYRLTVRDVVDYDSGLVCFMGAAGMRELFGMPAGYANVAYAAHPLDLDADAVFSTTTRDNLLSAVDAVSEQMGPMVATLMSASVAIALVVLYQMTKVMVDRSSQGIALMRVFGYRAREVRRLYLNGSLALVALTTPVLIVAAKAVIDAAYPSFIANVVIPFNVAWPAWLYAVVYAGVLVAYLLVRTLLVRHVNSVSPREVLGADA
ncbi:ABC transporter permease [Thermophilibacter immobilis]|uniref:ABC3 transporter permease C-terminal domain-containing protein n=1 Tax=Thermophilibacter immobilis TaxID=2779519 RepID=A0A7S7M9B9_9ACTN|nr:FtsX-like permease family protein [Thermophilibacter immobilis]QOY61119.1 hypothetical protein INP52_02635 [Thermophilibacter immobilis]